MEKAVEIFEGILSEMSASRSQVAEGKMMSAKAIQYKGKVFAFFHEGKMTFKLGKNFDIRSMGVDEYDFLSPFKNKPPMTAWFIVAEKYGEKWFELANKSLDIMIAERG